MSKMSNEKVQCNECGRWFYLDHARCPECGTENPDYDDGDEESEESEESEADDE